MKVGTDGVLLGAWTDIAGTEQILDIGTGTGLIALMLAQRSTAHIDAVEIESKAAIQAQENILRSPWHPRINVYPCDIQSYAMKTSKQYDLIVSNPPFFAHLQKASQPERALARHDDPLTPIDLLKAATQLLKPQGRLAVIYPQLEATQFQQSAKDFQFFCARKLWVKSTPKSPIKRVLMELSITKSSYQEQEIKIQTDQQNYTPEFINLIQDFYLKY